MKWLNSKQARFCVYRDGNQALRREECDMEDYKRVEIEVVEFEANEILCAIS